MKKQNFWLMGVLITLMFSCRTGRQVTSDAETNALFWEISGNGLSSPSYLLGTIHLACKEDIVFGEKLKTAVRNAREVFFELDLDDPAAGLSMLKSMQMANGKTLKDLFSESDYARLKKFFKDSLSVDITSMNQYKPFFLLSSAYPKLMLCKNMSGIDMELMKLAVAGKKTISGLESVEFQASVFDSIPYEVQAKELLNLADSFSVYRNYMAKMSADYKSRNLGSLRELMSRTDFDYAGTEEMMLNGRNRNWVKRLNEIMPGKNIFVAVGAGHLPGDQGLVNLLRKEGYTVRPAAE